MAKKSKTQKAAGKLKFKAAFIVFLVGIIVIVGIIYACYTRIGQKESSALVVSELLLKAAEGTKTPAPLDPKTGDIYFPHAGLYLPAQPDTSLQLTYSYTPGGWTEGAGPTLAVSSKAIFGQSAYKVLTASSSNEVFKHVPKLQACQRGVQLEYVKRTFSVEPINVIHLNNGKDLFMYTEPLCSELSELYDVLKTIQAY
jgi:hypothetical protein